MGLGKQLYSVSSLYLILGTIGLVANVIQVRHTVANVIQVRHMVANVIQVRHMLKKKKYIANCGRLFFILVITDALTSLMFILLAVEVITTFKMKQWYIFMIWYTRFLAILKCSIDFVMGTHHCTYMRHIVLCPLSFELFDIQQQQKGILCDSSSVDTLCSYCVSVYNIVERYRNTCLVCSHTGDVYFCCLYFYHQTSEEKIKDNML